MPSLSKSLRRLTAAILAVVFAALMARALRAQQEEDTLVRTRIAVTRDDIDAASTVKYSSYHVMAAGVPGAKERAAALNRENARQVAESEGRRVERKATLKPPYLFQGDLVKGSPKALTLASAVNHAVYIDSKGTIAHNWGNPEGYLTDLFASTFIHLADQYTNSTTDAYRMGKNASVSYPFYGNVIYEHELWAIVHAVATKEGYGPGAGHIYHLFLPNGVDTCFDESTECYSPDNFANWTFCAYHDAVNFDAKGDIGLVLFTVEPYQNVDGCAVHQPSVNGKLVDSTDSVLSHEAFETITDPIPGEAWTNQTSLDLQDAEVSDECQPVTDDLGDFLVPTFAINKKKYAVQLEYSNTYHTCAAQP